MSFVLFLLQNVLCIFTGIVSIFKIMYLRLCDSKYPFNIRKISTKGASAWHSNYLKGEIMELHLSVVSKDFSFCLSCVYYEILINWVMWISHLLSGNGDLWLEVYHFPSEAWLRELEVALSQKQVLYGLNSFLLGITKGILLIAKGDCQLPFEY